MSNKIITISLIILLTGCCSMQNKEAPVWITSNPEQAEVVIDGYHCGFTPVCLELNKKIDHTISISKSGFETYDGIIPSKRTFKSANNLIWPVAGAAIGTCIGIACLGTSGFIIPEFLIGTAIGTGVGLGVGAVGLGVDRSSRADCTLQKHFHTHLHSQ